MGIKSTVRQARAAGYKRGPAKPLAPGAKGVSLDAEGEGNVCYIGPCENGEREIYYMTPDGCTDGPYTTSEGCNEDP